MKPFKFNVIAELDHRTGRTMAIYFQFRKGDVHETREVVEGKAFADYDKKGILLGIEMLAPCKAEVLTRITTEEPVKAFIRTKLPKTTAWKPVIAGTT